MCGESFTELTITVYSHAAAQYAGFAWGRPPEFRSGKPTEGSLTRLSASRRQLKAAIAACMTVAALSGCSSLAQASAPAASQAAVHAGQNRTAWQGLPVVGHPWRQGLPQLGIDVYWVGNKQDSDAVIRAKAERIIKYAISLHANSIALTFPFYTYGISSNTVYADNPTTPSPAHIGIFLSVAAESHIRATIRPILNENALVAEDPNYWRGAIQPSSTSAWFASYRDLLLPYARVAQAEHAATFVIGTELTSLEGNSNWPSLVNSITSAYHGQIMYDENFSSFQANDANLPVSAFGVDAYPRFQLPDSASDTQLTQAWEGWLGTHSTAILHQTVLSEVGIAAVTGAYSDPGAWVSTVNSPVVTQVQANWYRSVCNAFTADRLAGLYWWEVNFDADPAKPAAFLSDRLTFLDRPAQQQISTCFASITANENGAW